MKTTYIQNKEEALKNRKWFIIDAADQVVGKVAIKATNILRGKIKPTFTPHVDCGDFVIVINAEKAKFTGSKEQKKVYHRHTGFPGGLKSRTAAEMRAKCPEKIIECAVKGMIPHNKLGDAIFRKLKVYAGAEHPHKAQNPETINL